MKKFIENLADALEMEGKVIDGNDKFRDYEEWDSLAVLSVIAMIKQSYNITIPRKEFDNLKTVSDLYSHISKSTK